MIELKPVPPEDALAFWEEKVLLSPGEFAKLSEEAKTMAFAVSGIARGDELATVYQALADALGSGTAYADFKGGCREIFDRRGWTGLRSWRVDNIFRTNIQTAYNVGRYRQLMEGAAARPYWQYDAVNDSRTRPSHLAMDGRVFPAESKVWDTWYPPNGYRCRCIVTALSPRDVERRGIEVETDDPTGTLVEPVDPRTGSKLPARPLIPDPGFMQNPGKTVWGGIVDASETGGVWKAMPDLPGPERYRRRAIENVRPGDIPDLDAEMLLPTGAADAFYKAEFLRRYGEEKVVTDAAGEPVILSLRSFLADKTPGAAEAWKFGKPGHGESIPLIEEMLGEPWEIWLTPQQNETGRIRLARRYIGLWKTEDRERIGGLAVFEVVRGVFQGVTAFTPFTHGRPDLRYVEQQRRGVLLFGR